jgi:endonuclease/exonuclease/phosphatase family metal-dependent hydrolase
MSETLRIATFNLENLDDNPGKKPTLDTRIGVMRPQLLRLRADVLCLQEVNGQEQAGQPRRLLALQALLADTPYAGYHLAHTRTTGKGEAYDERNLVILSRFPITATQQLHNDRVAAPRYRMLTARPAETDARDIGWERPLLAATLDLGGGRTLHLVNVHLKSKLPSAVPGQQASSHKWKSVAGWAEGYFLSSMKRVGQALEARVVVDELFDAQGTEALIAVCGDFNSELESVPLSALRGRVEDTGNAELSRRVLLPCELSVPESSRYSLLHLGRGAMLDHILVSRTMIRYYRSTEVHNELLSDESGAFRTDEQFPESDHAPVVAEFMLD